MDKEKIMEATKALIEAINEDPNREGLMGTPLRVARACEKIYGGYAIAPAEHLDKQFLIEKSNGIILVKDIELYSMCEHHMLPFEGTCHIAYIPEKVETKSGSRYKVFGVSKLVRMMEGYARRLQIQERLTAQIADAISSKGVLGCMVVIEATHRCMCMRGVEKQHSSMITSEMRGVFFDNQATREETLHLMGM